VLSAPTGGILQHRDQGRKQLIGNIEASAMEQSWSGREQGVPGLGWRRDTLEPLKNWRTERCGWSSRGDGGRGLK